MPILRIKEILYKRGITNSAFAAGLGISRMGVYKILNEKSNPSLERLQQIADFLGVKVGELFEDYNSKKGSTPPNHT
jgi:transcriptional regulator with XRE-family HTH domain